MKKILPLLTILSFAGSPAFSQGEIYFTWNARLQMNGAFRGEPIHLETQDVNIKLDYETTEMIIRFPVRSLRANVDTVNRVLQNNLTDVVFEGELSLDYINTESHPTQYFTVDGWLSFGNSKTRITGKGELHHINDSGELACCMLGMSIPLSLKELNIGHPWAGVEDEFEALITQAVLKNNMR